MQSERVRGAALLILLLLAACDSTAKRETPTEAEPYAVLDNPPADETPLPFADVAPEPPAADGGELTFRYCREARAAGVAPMYRGEPGYAPHLDRDGDGIACEPYNER